MVSIIRRLETGERWWAAEIVLRLAGLALLGVCAAAGLWVFRLANLPPPHQGTPLEFAGAAIAVVALSPGLALALEGPRLFRPVPLPPRPMNR